MFGKVIFLATLFFADSSVLAAPNPVCKTGLYKTLVSVLAKDAKVVRFCASLPSSNKLDRNKCPNQFKTLAYHVIQTFCGCIEEANTPTTPVCRPLCLNGETCDSSGNCACSTDPEKNYNDNRNCGKCGLACGRGETCTSKMCTCPFVEGTPDYQNDDKNCGYCGNVCPSSNLGGEECVGGTCERV